MICTIVRSADEQELENLADEQELENLADEQKLENLADEQGLENIEDETASSQTKLKKRHCHRICRIRSCSKNMKRLKRFCRCPCIKLNGEIINAISIIQFSYYIALQFAHCQKRPVPAEVSLYATSLTLSLESARGLYTEVVKETGTTSKHSRLAKRNAVSASLYIYK